MEQRKWDRERVGRCYRTDDEEDTGEKGIQAHTESEREREIIKLTTPELNKPLI